MKKKNRLANQQSVHLFILLNILHVTITVDRENVIISKLDDKDDLGFGQRQHSTARVFICVYH